MKICLVENYSETEPTFVKGLMELGHEVTDEMSESVDFIFNASIVHMEKAESYKGKYNKPLVNYCWDYYLFAHEGKHKGFDWEGYARFLKKSDIILVPSKGQKKRLKELLGLKSIVVETSIEFVDAEARDKRFVLDPVRYYEEENKTWVIDACKELNIPVIHSEHQFSLGEFRRLVNSCTFMTCGYVEASTGGLSLMEGLWNGKPSLVSNSPYMGASCYLGKFGTYFQYDSYEDLKVKLLEMWNNPPKIDVKEARKYMEKNFSYIAMAKQIEKILCEHTKNL